MEACVDAELFRQKPASLEDGLFDDGSFFGDDENAPDGALIFALVVAFSRKASEMALRSRACAVVTADGSAAAVVTAGEDCGCFSADDDATDADDDAPAVRDGSFANGATGSGVGLSVNVGH